MRNIVQILSKGGELNELTCSKFIEYNFSDDNNGDEIINDILEGKLIYLESSVKKVNKEKIRTTILWYEGV